MNPTKINTILRNAVFLPIPAICFLASLYLIVAPIIEEPALEYLYAAIFILAGLIFYFPFIYFKKVPSFMGAVTTFLQEVLEVVPPPALLEDEEDMENSKDEKKEIHSDNKVHAF